MDTRTIADRYTVTGRIGAGGGGVVWRATDDVLGRIVAVKEVQLPGHLPESEQVRGRTRALREARSAARLEHPSVVSIYDVFEGDHTLHIVMEYVDAPSLASLVARDGPLPPARVAAIGLDVLEGLAAAHRAGVVHRDVKPSNVLVPEVGPAVVTDFGVAAVLGESRLTLTGEALGTPDYISPEQLEDGPVGPPCDLWALGATLYDAVEGVPPFLRDHTLATIRGVASADPRPTERAGPLEPVLHRLLTKDPADRPDVDTTRELLRTAQQEAGRPRDNTQPVTDRTQPLPVAAPTDTMDRERTAPVAAATETVDHDDPAPAAPSDRVDRAAEQRRAAIVLGVLLAACAGTAAFWFAGDDDAPPATSDPEQEQVAASAPADDATEPIASEAPGPNVSDSDDSNDGVDDTERTQDTTTSDEPTVAPDRPADPPQDWRLHDGEAYAVGVPHDWTTRDAPGSAIDLVAPTGDTYLRVAHTDDPAADVLADTERIRDSFRSRYGTYEEVALETVEYRGHEAVRWEYTYSPGDRTLRAVHLNFSTGDRAYALNYQAPAATWDDVADRFDLFTSTFREG